PGRNARGGARHLPRARHAARRRAHGVFAAFHLRDAADRGGVGVPRLARDGQAPAGTRREEVRGGRQGSSSAARAAGARGPVERAGGGGGVRGGWRVMSENNLESLMRDVARTVQGDARRRQLLPEIQARLAKLDEQSRQAQRAHGTWRLTLLGAA